MAGLVGITTRISYDPRRIAGQVEKQNRRVLYRFGGLVRTVAKRSMRKRRGTSAPGDPPHAHTGAIRKSIRFAVDHTRGSVAVGVPAGRSDAPSVLEHGGVVKTRTKRRGRVRHARIRPRPYMAPAFAKGQEKLDDIWRQAARGGRR